MVKPQHRVAHNGQQGVEGQTHNDGGLSGPHKHHDNTQQSQGGGGLDEVHHPQDDLARPGIEVGENAQGDTGDEGKQQGHNDHGQVFKDNLEGHRSPPPFRMPRGTARRWRPSTREPSTKARMAAGTAPSRMRPLSLALTPA